MTDRKTPFKPVYGTEEKILQLPIAEGYLYFASDTGKIFLDAGNVRKQVGGSGGSGGVSSIYWAFADEESGTLVKKTEDEDLIYYMAVLAIENSQIPVTDGLIINADGSFFRVIDSTVSESGMFTVELIAVSGSGGGGGSTKDLNITWDNISSTGTNIYIYNSEDIITFYPRSTADDEVEIEVVVKDLSGANVDVQRSDTISNYDSFEFPVNLMPESDNLRMEVTINSQNSQYLNGKGIKKTFNIKVVRMEIQKIEGNMMPVVSTGVSLPYIPYFNGLINNNEIDENRKYPYKAILCYKVDNKEEIELLNPIPYSQNEKTGYASIPASAFVTHDVHTVDLYLKVIINGKVYTSASVIYEVPFIVDGDDTPLIWINKELGTVINYEPASLEYMVYSAEAARLGSTIQVQLLHNNQILSTEEVTYNGGRWLTLDLTPYYVVGQNNFTLVAGISSKDINFYVTAQGQRDLSLKHSESLLFNFDALGRSNYEVKSHRNQWNSTVGNFSAILRNFNWSNNGWLNDNDGMGSYLNISNGASVEIPLGIQTFNASGVPMTFEMRFRVKNSKKFATLVTNVPLYIWKNKTTGIECESGEELTMDEINSNPNIEPSLDEDGNYKMNEKNTVRKEVSTEKNVALSYLNPDKNGFVIGTQEAYFNLGGSVVNVRYKEDEIINLSFVVDRKSNSLSIYLNGILSGVINTSSILPVSMNRISILINSEYCDFDLFKIRAYQLGLSMPEIIHNYISDIKNIDLYDENQLTEANNDTKLSYDKLVSYNNDHPDSPTMPYMVIDLSGETSTGNNELPYAKTANGIDGTGITFVNPTADRYLERGTITPWEYYTHCPSYTANNVNINVQGTSSQIYPRRNFKTKFKKAKNWVYTKGPLAGRPVNYTYYFESDGFINEEVIETCVSIQDEIVVLEKDKNANKDAIKAKKDELKALKTLTRKELTKNWHEDSEYFGTNKFTLKIDYMESSGSYNTGFANLMGNNVYSKHPLDDLGISGTEQGYRTSVYGFPMLTFHKTAENAITYIGRYNCNLDKSSNERYGFELESDHPYVVNSDETHPLIADVAECWELRDNQGTWCSFRYPNAEMRATGFNTKMDGTTDRIEVARHFEVRYHKDADPFEWAQNIILNKENTEDYSAKVGGSDNDTVCSYLLSKLTNLEVLFNWLDSTDKRSATNRPLSEVIGQESISYRVSSKISDEEAAAQGITYSTEIATSGARVNVGTFTKDTVEYRRQKFYSEFDQHLDKHYCAVYFVMTELLLCYDSRGKNMMIASFGPHEVGGDYIWYPIFYDIDTQLGLNNVGAKLWDYDEDCTENGTFSTAQSVLWENFFDLFKEQITTTYRRLRSGTDESILARKNIEGAYNCDPKVFKSYAMEGRRPIIAMGLDIYYKYVLPTIEEWRNQAGTMTTANYLYACQGDRKLSRELLINNRLLYMDSKWLSGEFIINTGGMAGVMLRSTGNHETTTSDKYLDLDNPEGYEPGDNIQLVIEDENGHTTVHNYVYQPYKTGLAKYIDSDCTYEVTPYLNFYVTTFTDENVYQNDEPYDEIKYPNGQPTKGDPSILQSYITGRVDQQLNYFSGTKYISSFGDLSTKYINQIKLPDCPRLLDITLGSDAPEYFNDETLSPFELYTEIDENTNKPQSSYEKPLLEVINLSNLRGLNFLLDVRSPSKLKEFRALGTRLTNVVFADGAPLNTVHLPNTVSTLQFVKNKNLTRILTETPVVADIVNDELVYRDHASYEGLFVDGITNYNENNQGTGSSIVLLRFEEDNMGYDSYKILYNTVMRKYGTSERLQIRMSDVHWSPYILVEYGEEKDSNQQYYLLTDHNTFIPYSKADNYWETDTLNEKVYTKDNSYDESVITDLSLLDLFYDDYQDAIRNENINQFTNNVESMINTATYPTLSGDLYVSNASGDAIIETEIMEKYNKAWPNLNIRAAKVDESNIVKYVQREQVGENLYKDTIIDIKRVNKEYANLVKTDKQAVKQNYDFQGWTQNENYFEVDESEVQDLKNRNVILSSEQIEQLEWNGVSVYTFYAVFSIKKYTITFLDPQNDSIIYQYDAIYGTNLQGPNFLVTTNEDALEPTMRYKFLGWVNNKSDWNPRVASVAKVINVESIKCQIERTFYACFVEEDATQNVTDLKYFYFNDGLLTPIDTNNTILYGKISLPTTYNGQDVTRISGFRNQRVTYIYWVGEDHLTTIETECFYGVNTLRYFQFPTTLQRINDAAFQLCSVLSVPDFSTLTHLTYIGEIAFGGAFAARVDPYLGSLHLPGSVQTVGSTGFANFNVPGGRAVGTLQIGGPNDPSQISSLSERGFRLNSGAYYSSIYIYVRDGVGTSRTEWETYINNQDNMAYRPETGNSEYHIVDA